MSMDPAESVAAWLARAASGRSALKREAERLERAGPEARAAIVAEARRRGVDLPEDSASWPVKRLLRRAMAREPEARERRNPIHRDEGFTCMACGLEVAPGGRRVRDHCPRCLCSRHLDVVPGDRAAGCGGLMRPQGLALEGGQARLVLRCAACGALRRVRAHPEDDPEALARASAMADPRGAR